MVLKTFNLDKEVYSAYSKHCKQNGISMSKQVEKFIANELEKLNRNFKEDNVKGHHFMSKFC